VSYRPELTSTTVTETDQLAADLLAREKNRDRLTTFGFVARKDAKDVANFKKVRSCDKTIKYHFLIS
jgi:hypothetical protein